MSPNALPHKSAPFIVALCIGAFASWFVPRAALADRGTVRVGLIAPSTGTDRDEGADMVAGFQYYLASHGDRLGGFSVDLHTGDEGTTVETSLATAHELIEGDNVDVLTGLVSSIAAYGIVDYLDDRQVPLVIAGAGADELTQGKAKKWLFRVSHTSSQDVMPLGDYVCRVLKRKTIALIGVDIPYGWETLGGFARAYNDAGCRIVQEQYVPVGGDWQAAVAKIDRSASGVFADAGNADASTFVSAYYAALPGTALFGDSTLTNQRVLRAVREKALGIVSGSHYSAVAPNAVNTAFRLGYERLTGNPVTYFVENGYVAAQALAEALARVPAGELHPGTLAAQLRTVAFTAPRGPVRFDAYQQVVNNVYIRKVKQIGGRYRNEVIATYPATSQFWRFDPQKYLQLPTYATLKGTWVKT
jgi:branched-chain amino acid transport system substrate-binding protein